jgi:prepilin-type N-terminal cleavage/methylation domain-containing protein
MNAHSSRSPRGGFSLIEMIGVLAIMAILASVIVPNALRSLDRAAIRAEETSLAALGEQLKLYLRDNSALPSTAIPPATPNWTTQLASYADLSPTDLLTNKRANNRVYLVDPAAPGGRRAILLSSMRQGLNLPAATNINTAARFDAIWQTADGSVPPTSSWNGWNAWANTANAGDYLVIERVNLAPIYSTDLLTLTVSLNNLGGTTVSYNIVTANGSTGAAVNVAAGATAVLTNLHPRDRVNLYTAAGGVGLGYSYVVTGAGKTFDFDGSIWLPQ